MKNNRKGIQSVRQKRFIVLCAIAIGSLCILYILCASPFNNVTPVYRLLPPNMDYQTLVKWYPNIEPIYPNLVPDIVHYMQFLHSDVSFIFYLSVKSLIKYHNPALIMIHCDYCDNMTGNNKLSCHWMRDGAKFSVI